MLPKAQSSPGILQSGQQPSKGIRQIPHSVSLAIHFQAATPVQLKQVLKPVTHTPLHHTLQDC